jgi:putative component of toxin-antitoxin plasmid stabilization module
VVHELRAAIHQRLPRADQGYVGLALFAPVLERIQELRINPSQAGQVLGVYLVGLALIGV